MKREGKEEGCVCVCVCSGGGKHVHYLHAHDYSATLNASSLTREHDPWEEKEEEQRGRWG